MKNQLFKTPETGNIGIIAAILIVAAFFMWLLWEPTILSKSANNTTCKQYVPSQETYEIEGLPGRIQKYKLVAEGVMIDPYFTNKGEEVIGRQDRTVHLVEVESGFRTVNGNQKQVFLYQGKGGVDSEVTLPDGSPYRYSIPLLLEEAGGSESDIIYLTDKDLVQNSNGEPRWVFDVYIEENVANRITSTESYRKMSNFCSGSNVGINVTPALVVPTQQVSLNKKQIQMEHFTIEYAPDVPEWLNPHCKPIIYLYPEQKEDVHVLLNPKGFLTETIPHYPEEGWYVTAYPDGKIDYQNKTYTYLYYESKIRDEETKIPKSGFVRPYTELSSFFSYILPQMGLNTSEAKEFNDYWVKALPYAPYYFVGFMDSTSIDHIEPLTISPKPDTIIRVRAYFKALERPISVSEPKLITPSNREGFTVVEWGGMVKTDMNHPFTCSQ